MIEMAYLTDRHEVCFNGDMDKRLDTDTYYQPDEREIQPDHEPDPDRQREEMLEFGPLRGDDPGVDTRPFGYVGWVDQYMVDRYGS